MAFTGKTVRSNFIVDSGGVPTDADAKPTAVIYRNSTLVVLATVEVTKIGTGNYHVESLLDPAHDWAPGDTYHLKASWKIDGDDRSMYIAQGMIEPEITVTSGKVDVNSKDGFAPSAAQNASAVREELEVELERIDDNITSRTAPNEPQTISAEAMQSLDDLEQAANIHSEAIIAMAEAVSATGGNVTSIGEAVTQQGILIGEMDTNLTMMGTVITGVDNNVDDILSTLATFGEDNITVVRRTHVSQDGKVLPLVPGDDYSDYFGGALEWSTLKGNVVEKIKLIGGYKLWFVVGDTELLAVEGVGTETSTGIIFTVDLTREQTSQVTKNEDFFIVAQLPGQNVSTDYQFRLLSGTIRVQKKSGELPAI